MLNGFYALFGAAENWFYILHYWLFADFSNTFLFAYFFFYISIIFLFRVYLKRIYYLCAYIYIFVYKN